MNKRLTVYGECARLLKLLGASEDPRSNSIASASTKVL